MGPEAAPAAASRIRLGLIGDNIAASRSPDLHRIAGALCGLEVSYELFVPPELGKPFADVLAGCRQAGLVGVNVTYPYKEQVVGLLADASEAVRRIGSANTVLFRPEGPVGHNTDHSGFLAAYRAEFGERPPGRVALFGAGGVGRAIAFALGELGATELRLFDAEPARAASLAEALRSAGFPMRLGVAADPNEAASRADGLVNATPVGMVGRSGSAVPANLIGGQAWAFDAVYTPVETEFLCLARSAGLHVLSGYELFFQQGIACFRLFTGMTPADPADLRRRLALVAA